MLFLCVFCVNAQNNPKSATVKVTVVDNLTQRTLYAPKIAVASAPDFGKVDCTAYSNNEYVTVVLNDVSIDYYFIIRGAYGEIDYNDNKLRTSTEYEPDTIMVTSKQLVEAKFQLNLPTIKLKRQYESSVQLGEVLVTASKVVFYHRGDTLIYNADAFVLPYGSMLDALIEQLPGVKIDNNGVITANGRKVDNLILDGKDLFSGKGEILLENLPAYTVKDIAVYDKSSDLGEFLGRKTGDEQYVMDVRLKRDYHLGVYGHADVGYGSKNKYLAKLFALNFGDNHRLAFHFNANNLSDVSLPGNDDGSWAPDKMSGGVKTSQVGGIKYSVEALPWKWRANGSVDVENISDNLVATTTRQNYYPGSDTYDYIFSNNRSKKLKVESYNYLRKQLGGRAMLYVNPYFSYTRKRNTGVSRSISYDAPNDSALNNADGLWYYDQSNAGKYITRNVADMLDKGSDVTGRVSSELTYRTKTTGYMNTVTLTGMLQYNSRRNDLFDRYLINYSADSVSATSKYFNGNPDHTVSYSVSAKFKQYISLTWPDNVDISYTYSGENSVTISDLYLLSNIKDFDWQNTSLGILPSTMQYLGHIDVGQSYNTKYDEGKHTITVFGYKNVEVGERDVFCARVNGRMQLYNRRFNYFSGVGDQRITRNKFLPDLKFNVSYNMFDTDKNKDISEKKWKLFFDMEFDVKPQMISMLDAVERVNTTDPLYLRVGNPDLKDSYRYIYEFNIANEFFRRKLQQNFKFRFEFIDNAIAEARFYNPVNGVTTSRPTNIDGNRSFMLDYGLSTPLFKKPALTFSTNTTANFIRSRDLSSAIESAGIDGDFLAAANVINTSSVGETLKLDYTFGQHRVSAVGEARYNDYRSHDQGFQNFTSWTARYGATGVIALPEGFGLSTDLTVYTRRGFTDARLNTSDVVWNARLTKSIMKGNMTFAVDAYDMLRQLSNITYTVNAQARTEVVTNVVPAYVLFHVMYRFNHQPKRH